jgi:hypothetical protein
MNHDKIQSIFSNQFVAKKNGKTVLVFDFKRSYGQKFACAMMRMADNERPDEVGELVFLEHIQTGGFQIVMPSHRPWREEEQDFQEAAYTAMQDAIEDSASSTHDLSAFKSNTYWANDGDWALQAHVWRGAGVNGDWMVRNDVGHLGGAVVDTNWFCFSGWKTAAQFEEGFKSDLMDLWLRKGFCEDKEKPQIQALLAQALVGILAQVRSEVEV